MFNLDPQIAFIIVLIFVALYAAAKGLESLLNLRDRFKGAPAEPLHNPTVDKKIADSVERSEQRTAELIGSAKAELKVEINGVRKDIEEKNTQVHGRISGFRKEVSDDLKETSGKVEAGVNKMLQLAREQGERVSKVEAMNEGQTAEIARLDRKCEALNDRKADKKQ